MVKRFLITTALEDTWLDDVPVLFLGEWCRRYSRRDHWQEMDGKVLPYHWNDRNKLYDDYLYLQKFYEELLLDLSKKMNLIHGVDFSVRYWRILIGPWLGYFIQMLFDRWESIHQALGENTVTETIVLSGGEENFTPHDMTDFSKLYISDEWNHHIYSTILQEFTTTKCINRSRCCKHDTENDIPVTSWKRKVKSILSKSYSWTANFLSRRNDAFFLATYLPMLDEMKLHFKFRQVPQYWRAVPSIFVSKNCSSRQWVLNCKSNSVFEKFVRTLIPRQIPTIYLEGYKKLLTQTKSLPWPAQPKIIWTSNSHSEDDVFKAWAAQKVEQGSPLVIGQHGGHYGIGRWSFLEEHEIKICDCYFSWGWKNPDNQKVKALGQLKSKQTIKRNNNEKNGALLVTCALPRFSYSMYSVFISSQYLDYFDDQCLFIKHLPQRIRNCFTVRLFPEDYGWDQEERWRDRFPALKLDNGKSKIENIIKQSRLYVSTYNATTFLESFTMNVPTVIYWNPDHWELRDSAVPYFDELKRVGIFHDNPRDAALHVKKIWNNIDAWWLSPEVQDTLKTFTFQYSRMPNDLLVNVESALREVSGTSCTYLDVDL